MASIPADGAKDVSLSEGIKLTFTANVVYMTIRDDNKKCLVYSPRMQEDSHRSYNGG